MLTKEKIKALKTNRVPCYLLTLEEWEVLVEVKWPNLDYHNECEKSKWAKNLSEKGFARDSDFVFRISSDYQQPEKMIMKRYEIKNYSGKLKFEKDRVCWGIDYAPRFVNFDHFEEQNGNYISIEYVANKIRTGITCYAVFAEENND